MPATPNNCFICKTYWAGSSPICDTCLKQTFKPQPKCGFCLGAHETKDCLDARLYAQRLKLKAQKLQQQAASRNAWKAQANMRRRTSIKPSNPWHKGSYQYQPPMKTCHNCKSNYLIESKAGSVCSNCKTVIHNPCRECYSANTRGITGPSTNERFIECVDCCFIE